MSVIFFFAFCLKFHFRHALFEVKIQDGNHMKIVASLEVPLELDIWTYVEVENNAVVLVPKKNVEQFQEELRSNGVQFRLDVENIKR